MRIIYFDCANGISGDMVYNALRGLLGDEGRAAQSETEKLVFPGERHLSRSYNEVADIIKAGGMKRGVTEKAILIYSVIAEAEAAAHRVAVEEVHFHEVGRDKAIENIVGAAACVDTLDVDKILCSKIRDGKGFIECAHGVIPVPVPAVAEMMKGRQLAFSVDESVESEMVTPTGLGILIGLGAEYREEMPAGEIKEKSTARGGRETGRSGGLTAYLLVM